MSAVAGAQVSVRPNGALRRAGILLAAAALVGAVVVAKVPLCPVAIALGQPCPACGMTRATLAILGGDFGGAFDLQPFAFAISPIFGVWIALAARSYVAAGRASLPPRVALVVTTSLIALHVGLIVFWIARFYGFWGGPVPV
jgi:hypothetical protein